MSDFAFSSMSEDEPTPSTSSMWQSELALLAEVAAAASPVVCPGTSAMIADGRNQDPNPSEADNAADAEDEATVKRRRKMKKVNAKMSKTIARMMYGMGDDENPHPESVSIIQNLVVEYISTMTRKAADFGHPGIIGSGSIMFYLRKDSKKYARAKELCKMRKKLQEALRPLNYDELFSEENI